MTIGLRVDIRNARLNLIADAIDADAAPGYMNFYTAPRPATGAAITAQTLLGSVTFSRPCAASASGGEMVFAAVTQEDSGLAGGDAAWTRVFDGSGAFVMDMSCGTEGTGADVIMSTVTVVEGGPISVSSAKITAGNA